MERPVRCVSGPVKRARPLVTLRRRGRHPRCSDGR
jgi:hypothetical protein